MAGEKEIRSKIASVKNMQKITSAMEKVAASKIRKAQLQMEASRPYAERIRRVIGHLAHANPDYKHPFLTERETKRVGYIVISTDRGLCGGLNANLFKKVIGEISDAQSNNVEVDLALVGAKAVAFFRRMGGSVVGTATHLGDKPSVNDLIGSIKIMLDSYSDGKIDRLYVVHNEFVSAMSQVPVVTQLLRLDAANDLLRPFHQFIELFVRADIESAEPLEELGEVEVDATSEARDELRVARDTAS